MPQEMRTYQSIYSRNWETGELKIMTPLVNKIYMSGDWPKDFLDVTMIALPKKNQAKKCIEQRTYSLI